MHSFTEYDWLHFNNNSTWLCSYVSGIGPGVVRQQAIIWTNVYHIQVVRPQRFNKKTVMIFIHMSSHTISQIEYLQSSWARVQTVTLPLILGAKRV